VGRLALAAGLFAVVLFVTGCGSSSGAWEVVDQTTVPRTDHGGYLHVRVGRPSDVEMKVEAKPNVTVQTSYTVLCGAEITDDTPVVNKRNGASGRTPLTAPILLPKGEPATCLVNVLATKSAPADMTLTLQMRSTPAA
jgi:hypothetical protein